MIARRIEDRRTCRLKRYKKLLGSWVCLERGVAQIFDIGGNPKLRTHIAWMDKFVHVYNLFDRPERRAMSRIDTSHPHLLSQLSSHLSFFTPSDPAPCELYTVGGTSCQLNPFAACAYCPWRTSANRFVSFGMVVAPPALATLTSV